MWFSRLWGKRGTAVYFVGQKYLWSSRVASKSHSQCTANLKKSILIYCLLCIKAYAYDIFLCMLNLPSGLSSQYCIALFKRTDLLITISWLFILCCSAAFSKQFQYANQNRLWPYESHSLHILQLSMERDTLLYFVGGNRVGSTRYATHVWQVITPLLLYIFSC